MNKMRQAAALIIAGTFLSRDVQAAPLDSDFEQAVNQIQSDLNYITTWTADQFKYAVPFNATAGAVVPAQLKLLGFELGIEAMASGTDVDRDALHQQPTTIINTREIDAPDTFGMPSIIVHGKIGLPWGFDAGVRMGGIPETDGDEGDTKFKVENKIFGIDIRKALIEEGMGKPGLTLGFNYTHASGDVSIETPVTAESGVTVDGSADYISTLDATSRGTTEWDVDSVGLQAVLNKKMLIFNPYIGAGVNRNIGDISVKNSTVGTVTLTENGTSTSASDQFSTGGSATREVNKWDVRALLGVEISLLPFMRLGLHGEYAGKKNAAGGLGLRLQFR